MDLARLLQNTYLLNIYIVFPPKGYPEENPVSLAPTVHPTETADDTLYICLT